MIPPSGANGMRRARVVAPLRTDDPATCAGAPVIPGWLLAVYPRQSGTNASMQNLLQERQPVAGEGVLRRRQLPPDGGRCRDRLGLRRERFDDRVAVVVDFL